MNNWIHNKFQTGCQGLHYAAQEGFLDLVKTLIEEGAHVNCFDQVRKCKSTIEQFNISYGGFKSPFWPVEQYFTRILIWILNATSLCKTNTVCLLLCCPKNIFIFDFMFTLWSLKPCSKTNCAYIHMYANFFLAYHRSFTNLQGRLIIYFQWVN